MDGLFRPICLTIPARLTTVRSWHGHIPFAFWLIDRLRPQLFVELGVHSGDSYCAFCQAVTESAAGTRCVGVDSWRGDDHAIDYDGTEVLSDLRAVHDPLYGQFSTLLPLTFDDARDQLDDGSIDVLHIDGFHTCEAVRHDFDTYRAKLSSRGIVLLHDTQVREPASFGVWRFWEEVCRQFPHFEFDHSNGLGVLAVGPEAAELLPELFAASRAETVAAQALFARLGSWVCEMSALRFDLHRLTGEVKWLHGERNELLRSRAHAEHERGVLTAEIAGMRQSLSWKLGTVLTKPARALRRVGQA